MSQPHFYTTIGIQSEGQRDYVTTEAVAFKNGFLPSFNLILGNPFLTASEITLCS